MRPTRPPVLLAGVAALVAACSSSTAPATTTPAGPTTDPSPTTTAPTGSAVGTPFDCRDPIGHEPAPPADYQVLDGSIALLTAAGSGTALQTGRTSEDDPAHRLFAKTGLLVHAGTQAELVVPAAWSGRLAVAWGNTATEPTEHLVVGPCDGAGPWLAYPGGYYVSEPACVELIVRIGGADITVTIGVGAPCPGQQPPPEPTAS